MTSIDALLTNYCREAGFDSSGELTVDRQVQARKLSEHWGLSKLNPLLFAVQAAHAAELGQLDLDLQSTSWRISFHLDSHGDGPTCLQEQIQGDEAASHLELFRRLYLAALSCAQQVAWLAEGHRLVLRLDFRQASLFARLREKLLGEELRAIRKGLVERCSLGSLPIFFNKQLINSGMLEDSPGLGITTSFLSLEPVYWDNGPWIVERLYLAENHEPASFVLANRGIRGSEACLLHGKVYIVPELPGHFRTGRLCSCLSILENAPPAQVHTEEWSEDKTYYFFDGSKDVFHKLKLREHFVLGARSYHMGGRSSGGRIHDLVIFADGLANCLSPMAHEIKHPDWTEKRLEISLPSIRTKQWVALRGSDPAKSSLRYVKHGVLLDPVPLDSIPFPTCAIRADNGVRTDYSGLRVVLDDQVNVDCQWVRESSQQLIAQLSAYKERGEGPLGVQFTQAFQDSIQRAANLEVSL